MNSDNPRVVEPRRNAAPTLNAARAAALLCALVVPLCGAVSWKSLVDWLEKARASDGAQVQTRAATADARPDLSATDDWDAQLDALYPSAFASNDDANAREDSKMREIDVALVDESASNPAHEDASESQGDELVPASELEANANGEQFGDENLLASQDSLPQAPTLQDLAQDAHEESADSSIDFNPPENEMATNELASQTDVATNDAQSNDAATGADDLFAPVDESDVFGEYFDPQNASAREPVATAATVAPNPSDENPTYTTLDEQNALPPAPYAFDAPLQNDELNLANAVETYRDASTNDVAPYPALPEAPNAAPANDQTELVAMPEPATPTTDPTTDFNAAAPTNDPADLVAMSEPATPTTDPTTDFNAAAPTNDTTELVAMREPSTPTTNPTTLEPYPTVASKDPLEEFDAKRRAAALESLKPNYFSRAAGLYGGIDAYNPKFFSNATERAMRDAALKKDERQPNDPTATNSLAPPTTDPRAERRDTRGNVALVAALEPTDGNLRAPTTAGYLARRVEQTPVDAPRPVRQDEQALANALQTALRQEGFAGARVELWDAQTWRASGVLLKGRDGDAQFVQAFGASPNDAAEKLRANLSKR